jgi:hypothetical protein
MAPNARHCGKNDFSGNLSMSIEDTFEMLMKIFHCDRWELVKDTSDFHAIIYVRVVSILGGKQWPIGLHSSCRSGVSQWRSPSTRRISMGTSLNKAGEGSISVILAGVRSAATDNQAAATTETPDYVGRPTARLTRL